MKKTLIIGFIVAVAVAMGVYLVKPAVLSKVFVPKGEQAYQKYYVHLKSLNERRFMEEPGYRWDYQEKSNVLREAAVSAFIADRDYRRAIPILEDIIEDLGKPETRYSIEFKVSKPRVKLRATYCDQLAFAYERVGDMPAAQAAQKKATSLHARAEKMK